MPARVSPTHSPAPRSVARASRGLLRGSRDDPLWARPALIAVALLAGASMLTDVTRSGYGNTYYATGALAASQSWSAFLTNAADLGGYVSLDKGPLSDWTMGLSGRLFGFSSFSVMLPNALAGTATVIVLHAAVRRALGHQIAILAALIMALTPVAVLVGRYDTPDALLALMLVCAAWSMTRALESGRTRELLLCGAFVGLAFNTKMLEAYIVLPALALCSLLGGRGSRRRRLMQSAAAAGVALLVSFVWFTAMMLVAPGERPYVGDTTGNSWFQLILEGNGVKRIAGGGQHLGSDVPGRLLRLFSHHIGGQIAWLLPLALVGLVLGLLTTWDSRRTSPAWGAYLLWSTWGLLGYLVFSLSTGLFHDYYTSLLAPAVATLAAAALVTLWRAKRVFWAAVIGLAGALAGTSLLSFILLARAAGFVPWLRWVVLGCGALAGAGVLATRVRASLRGAVARMPVIGAAAIALLAGPAAYSLATVTRAHTGYDPIAGPVVHERRSIAAHAQRPRLSASASPALLIAYLSAHRHGARFIVAATDAATADPIALATRRPVITVGGFGGADPTPTAPQLERLVAAGRLRYFLLDGARESPGPPHDRVLAAELDWVKRHCSPVSHAAVSRPGGELAAGSASNAHAPASGSTLTLFACGSAATVRRP